MMGTFSTAIKQSWPDVLYDASNNSYAGANLNHGEKRKIHRGFFMPNLTEYSQFFGI